MRRRATNFGVLATGNRIAAKACPGFNTPARSGVVLSRAIRRSGFTLFELMLSLMIFAMASTAGAYMFCAAAENQTYFKASATSASEVEFAMSRIIENLRAATSATIGTSPTKLTLVSLPNSAIGGATFTITYTWSNGNLTETYVSNGTDQTQNTSATLVHGVTSFTVSPLSGAASTYQITISAGTQEPILRKFTVFGRNL